jgi:hypothetical protein
MAPFQVGEEWGRGNGRGGEGMGWQRHFGWSGGAREVSQWPEVSRVAALQPMAGGGLGCLTRGGRGTMGPSGPAVLGRLISEKKQNEK